MNNLRHSCCRSSASPKHSIEDQVKRGMDAGVPSGEFKELGVLIDQLGIGSLAVSVHPLVGRLEKCPICVLNL